MSGRYRLNRRTALVGGAGAAMGGTWLRSGLLAQEGGTPEAAEPDESGRNARRERLEEAVVAALAAVQADRDAVVSQIEPAAIDDLIGRATDLAGMAGTGDDKVGQQRLRAVFPVLGAAELLIGAQLVIASTPSREGPASRGLARAHAVVQAASENLDGAGDPEVAALLSTAQEFYALAYGEFGARAYIPAARTGQAAALLCRAARIVEGDVNTTRRRSRGGNHRGQPDQRGRRAERWLDMPHRSGEDHDLFMGGEPPFESREPVDVPEPDF